METIVEFKVTRTLFDDVQKDPEFRLGFEAEFHVRNASDLLSDEEGYLPSDFETFNNAGSSYKTMAGLSLKKPYGAFDWDEDQRFHHDTVLLRLCALFSNHMGLPQGAMSIDDSNYQNWRLTLDSSLYNSPGMLSDPDHDLGVELVSPVMTLSNGLGWMAKVFEMIDNFTDGQVSLYTSRMCGFHVNLSHIRMGLNFDYAKLAILSGDAHYLADFDRLKNGYAAPLMQAVYDQLVTAKEQPAAISNPKRATAALGLLNMRGWSPQRVMQDLAALIPMSHYFSFDLSKLETYNPYIELRVAGNADYQRRYEEIAQLTIRIGALIKIACDPYAFREEYLKKIYQLVSGVATQQPEQPQSPEGQGQTANQTTNPFPRLRIYLSPIMSTATRQSLDMLETYWRRQALSIPNGSYLTLAIIRSAIDLRQQNTPRVRQGLVALIRNVLRIEPIDLVKSLNNKGLLQHYGVLRSQDKPLPLIALLTNYLKGLHLPLAPAAAPAA